MSQIFFLMGKSASGKDELAGRILADEQLCLKPVVLYTTRPKREGEKNGREYIFISDDERLKLHKEGKVIEERVYHTVFGDWYYFTVADEGLNINGEDNYFVINTLEAFLKYREYFGEERVIPIYVEVTPEIRMKRALEREGRQAKPSIDEVKRRFAADDVDFAEEKLADAGITNRFSNDGDIDECFLEIKKLIKGKL